MSDHENETKNSSGFRLTRRSLLKLVGAASAYTVLPGSGTAASTQDAPGKKKVAITYSGYPYDRVAALTSGDVEVEGCKLTYAPDRIGNLNTHVFSGAGTRDVSEVGLHPFMLAWANEEFRDYTLLPVFPLRVFRHKSIFIRTDRGIDRPEDLRGKRIATPGYSSTSLTWIRGVLADEYGVTPEDVEWVATSKAVDATAGETSKQEKVVPEGLTIHQGPSGKDESDLLESGEVDAVFHATEPRAYVERNPIVARLFADYRQVERDYFAKTGVFPIMHAVAVRDDVIDENPWFLEAVFKAYSRAKKMNDEFLKKLGWAMISAPWLAQELEETRELMGDNFWPYGIEPNRKALETLFRYSYEQGLASRELTIEELFHPSTLEFSELVT